MDTPDRYRRFADYEAAGSSPTYERLARAVAASPSIVGLLDRLPAPRRQPNLLFAASRLVGTPIADPAEFVARIEASWPEISAVMRERSTQTNEAARTGTFLPLISGIPGPIALVEVGCSAGLCLYPDRYAVSYDGEEPLAARSTVRIDVTTNGAVSIPTVLPHVVARIGIDLNPLDADDEQSRSWLEALVWPEHDLRLARLRAALDVVRAEPPMLLKGDLTETIEDALALVPAGATPVVFHAAVLNYVSRRDRRRFTEKLEQHPEVVWIANEGPGVIEGLTTDLRPPIHAASAAYFVTSRGREEVVGISDPHGSWISW